jgi:aminotransferase
MKAADRVAKHVATLPPSGIRRFFDLVSQMEDAISLSIGEPDFHTPWNISETAIYAIEKGQTHYTSNAGLIALRQLICRYYRERYGVSYEPDEVIVTIGASEGIDLALRALLDPGDEVIIPAPSYVSYAPGVTLSGGVPVPIPTRAENACKVTPEEILSRITPKTKAMILPYPNNPTGAILTREELEAIAKALEGTDIIVITDEVYSELTYGRRHVSIASIPSMRERTIVINGFSKAFAMTGWRLGYMLAPRELLSPMLRIHQYVIMCAPTMSQYAGLEALRSGFEDNFSQVESMVREYDRRRRFLLDGLRKIGLPCFEPEGAFYAFPYIGGTGLSSEEFCKQLLNEKKIAVVPGNAFGESGEGFIRISYAASMQCIKTALERMGEFLSERQG